MDRQDYVIEVSHVSKSFKDNKVLKDVSLLCESGKIYGLVGTTVLERLFCLSLFAVFFPVMRER